ncbi:MAG: hypothetical protein U0X75_18315 [Acidobacteriota bacterium]
MIKTIRLPRTTAGWRQHSRSLARAQGAGDFRLSGGNRASSEKRRGASHTPGIRQRRANAAPRDRVTEAILRYQSTR